MYLTDHLVHLSLTITDETVHLSLSRVDAIRAHGLHGGWAGNPQSALSISGAPVQHFGVVCFCGDFGMRGGLMAEYLNVFVKVQSAS